MAVGGPSSPPHLLEDRTKPHPTSINVSSPNPKSFADIVKAHHKTIESEPIDFFPAKVVSVFQGRPSVAFTLSEKSSLIANMHFVLIGKFSHGRPTMNVIRAFFAGLKLKGVINLSLLDSKHLVIECVTKSDFVRIWVQLFWSIKGFIMRVFKWDDDFNPFKESPIAPVWIRIEGLPIYMFDEKTLMSISNSIGNPLKVDPSNVARTNLASARICVELDVSKQLMDAIWVRFVDDGSKKVVDGFWAKVYYDVVPPFCSSCFHIGHGIDVCKRPLNYDKEAVQGDDQHLFDKLSQPAAMRVFDKMPKSTSVNARLPQTDKISVTSAMHHNSGNVEKFGKKAQVEQEKLEGIPLNVQAALLGTQEQHSVDTGSALEVQTMLTKAGHVQQNQGADKSVADLGEARDQGHQVKHSSVVSAESVQNFMQQLSSNMQDQQDTVKAVVQGDVQNFMQPVVKVADHSLQGAKVAVAVDILSSEGLDFDSNQQQHALQGADVAVELPGKPNILKQQKGWQQNALKRQTGCVGNNCKNGADSATIVQPAFLTNVGDAGNLKISSAVVTDDKISSVAVLGLNVAELRHGEVSSRSSNMLHTSSNLKEVEIGPPANVEGDQQVEKSAATLSSTVNSLGKGALPATVLGRHIVGMAEEHCLKQGAQSRQAAPVEFLHTATQLVGETAKVDSTAQGHLKCDQISIGIKRADSDAIKRADSEAYNVGGEVAVTTPECHGQIGMVDNTFTQAVASEHVCQNRQDGSIVVDVKASNFGLLADDSFSCFMSSQKHNTTALASKQIDIVAGHADSSLSKGPIEKRLSWANLAKDDEIETISKLTLSEAKEYAIASSISFKKRRGRPSGRNKRSPR